MDAQYAIALLGSRAGLDLKSDARLGRGVRLVQSCFATHGQEISKASSVMSAMIESDVVNAITAPNFPEKEKLQEFIGRGKQHAAQG
jgi:hypothetical protein